jgi:streptogramin lyase
VTGGDFDRKNNQFILVGYEIQGMGSFSPFIAILNRDLTLQKFFELPGFGQVEGMCVTPNGEVWFTQEDSFFSSHKLVKLNITK